VKNRFGSSRELGVFEMDGEGLREVSNPSSLFLSERTHSVSGTAICAPLEGSRPLLVELQALVTPSGLAVPRRTSVGIEGARISLLAAILEKHMKLQLAQQDLFFNVAGGLRISEPACDLAAAAAIWSSYEDRPLPLGWAFVGELGLTGEVRRVSQTDLRIEEAKRLGFKAIVLPQSTPPIILERLAKEKSLKIVLIGRIDELPRIFS
jgi:DNA repair protein RadA/Sms